MNLKKELADLADKHERTQLDLDQIMENQSKQDFVTNESIKKEQEVFKKRFDQALEQNIKIVNDQNVKIEDLTNKIVILAKENL